MLFRLCFLLTILASTTPLLAFHGDCRDDPEVWREAQGGSVACQFAITPANQSFLATGGSGAVTLTSSEPQCAWAARSNVPWITITSATNGTGSGLVNFAVAPAISPRSGTLTIAGRTFTVWQSVNPCAAPSFAFPTPLAVTRGLLKFAVGDFNGDGRFDVVTLAYADQYLLAFAPGASAGGVSAPQSVPLGFTPQNVTAMRAADFNRDGKLDLLFVNSTSNQVAVLFGDGSGGFGAPASFDLSTSPPIFPALPRQTVIADLNNDRNPDIIFCDNFTARLSVLIGNGAGGFNPPLIHTLAETSTRALMLEAGDFNGDGKTDLIYLINGSFQFLFLPGNGTGGFARGTLVRFIDSNVSGFVEPADVAIGDVTGDGRGDVIIASSKGLSIVPGNGSGGFAGTAMYLRDSAVGGVRLGDFDGDGRTDIAASARGVVTLFRSLGGGNFAAPAQFDSGGNGFSPDTALVLDFNRDGLSDLFLTASAISADPSSGFLLIPGNRNTGLAAPPVQPFTVSAYETALADLNGDGLLDLAAIHSDPGGRGVTVSFGNGAGGFGSPISFPALASNSLAVHDLDLDGNLDITFNNAGAEVYNTTILFGDGRGAFPRSQLIPTGRDPMSLGVGDFNNDGKLDLIVKDTSNGLALMAGNGGGTFTALTSGIAAGLGGGYALAVGDYNGDGSLDLAVATEPVRNCQPDKGSVTILIGDGRGGFDPAPRIDLPTQVYSLAADDLNGDGRSDLIISGCSSAQENNLIVALASPNGGFAALVGYPVKEPNQVVTLDISGDGRPDLTTVFGRSSVGTRDSVIVLTNKGDGSFGDPLRLLTAANVVSVGDVNEDGTADLTLSKFDGVEVLFNLSRCVRPGGVAVTSAASYSGVKLAAESIAVLFGLNLTNQTQAAASLPLPTELAGVGVRVKDTANVEHLAPLFFASPSQINFQIPPGASPGMAVISVATGSGAGAMGVIQITPVSPTLFSADASGTGYPAATILRIKGDGSQSYEPVVAFNAAQNRFVALPIDLGPPGDQVFLILFGTGVRNRRALSTVTARIGGESAEALFAGAQGGFVGLDQINLRLPRSLAGRGEVDVLLTVNGKTANAVKVNIK